MLRAPPPSRSLRKVVLASFLSFAFSNPLAAATFNYISSATYPDVAPRSCYDSQISQTSAVSECNSSGGEFTTKGQSDRDGLRAGAKIAGTLPELQSAGGTSARASAMVQDVLTFSIASGFFRMAVDVGGSTSRSLGPKTSGVTTTGTRVAVNVGATTDTGKRTNYNVYIRTFVLSSGDGIDRLADSNGVLGINYVDLPFVNSTLNFDAILDTSVFCTSSYAFSAGCSSEANFLSTVKFVGGTILDQTGGVVAGASVSSASGFDYLGPIAPSPVPLPAGGILLGSVLLLLGAGKVRSRHSA